MNLLLYFGLSYIIPILFSVPSLLLVILIIKIHSGEKFKNIIFIPIIILVVLLYLFSLPIGMVITNIIHLKSYAIFIFVNTLQVLSWTSLVLLPLCIIYSLYKYFKDKNFLKNFYLSISVLLIILLAGFPIFVGGANIDNYKENNKFPISKIKNWKIAERISLLPILKGYYSEFLLHSLVQYEYNELGYENEKEYFDEYIKYFEIAQKSGVESDIFSAVSFCKRYKQYDKALEIHNSSKYKPTPELYIYTKDYETALKLLPKKDEVIRPYQFQMFFAIYLELNDFEKLNEYLELYKKQYLNESFLNKLNDNNKKIMYEIYYRALCLSEYKQGNIESAEKIYIEHLKDKDKYLERKSFKEYIEYLSENFLRVAEGYEIGSSFAK